MCRFNGVSRVDFKIVVCRCVEFKNSLCPCVEFRYPPPYIAGVIVNKLYTHGVWAFLAGHTLLTWFPCWSHQPQPSLSLAKWLPSANSRQLMTKSYYTLLSKDVVNPGVCFRYTDYTREQSLGSSYWDYISQYSILQWYVTRREP